MFSGHKGTNTFNIFGLKWQSQSSLSRGFLNDVSPEIELSDYGTVPSPGSESPSALLHGESLKLELIADLDLFFERLYSYYCENGLWCIIVKWVVELLSLAFTVCFSGFFLLYVDWNGLRNAKCGIDAVESGIRPCDLAKEALHQHPLTPFTLHKAVILGYLGLFSIYWTFCFLRFFAQLKCTLRIRDFYYSSLHVTDKELQTMPWASVLEKVVRVQSTHKLCVVKDLSTLEVVMRLLRKENYLIGMINKGILAFPIPKWIPGAGPTVKFTPNGEPHRLILTKTLEWTLNWCILQSMFDRNFCIRRDFISNPTALKKRLVATGLVMLLLSPFLVIFMLVYLFLRHAEQFYNHPTTASSRRWSNLSRWMFREFNEVDHLFKHRINSSVVHASDFLKQFPSPIISIVAKFISFISGGFAAVLIIIAFLDESLLEGHILGRNLIWYAAVFGTITAISRAAVTDELLVLDPEREMSMVVQHTHYMPKRWRGKEHTGTYTAMMWLEEMASIFLTPYLLVFVVSKRVDDILQFVADFTVNLEGVGHVCSFSAFDFETHGNINYGSPCNSERDKRSSQGNFQSSYLYWQPDPQGIQFLLNLKNFRDQQLQGVVTCNPQTTWHWNPTIANRHTRNHHLNTGSMWLMETDSRSHPYLLDWYYASRPSSISLTNAHRGSLDTTNDEPHQLGIWIPPFSSNNVDALDSTNTTNLFGERSSSHLDASTSTASRFFNEQSTFRDPTMTPWWARAGELGSHLTGPQESFIEPPEFNRTGPLVSFVEPSDLNQCSTEDVNRSLEEVRSYNSLSRTAYRDELASIGEFKLHFDDIYG
ncbi:hypothetical protein V2J09_015641 [Rumex salicifolius]